jgi:hypothetical protein
MGSFQPPRSPRGAFQAEDLAVLDQAFDDIWSTVITHHPSQAENSEFRTLVSEKLCELAAAGVMERDQLRAMTLASLQLL